MKTVVLKTELLDILRANRDQHEQLYQEAVEGWLEDARTELEAGLEKLAAGEKRIIISTQMPESHMAEYDRNIRMLELTQEEQITLSEEESARFIMDDWDWARSWFARNSKFSSSTAQLSSARYGDG